jgi:Tfp pilus assembly protein PilV
MAFFHKLRKAFPASEAGVSIIEIVIATGVVAFVMTATLAVISVSLRTTVLSQNKSLATKYTQEGVEYFRAQRNLMGWEGFIDTIEAGTLFCLNQLTYTATGGLEQVPARACTQNEFVDSKNRFKREAQVTYAEVAGEGIVTVLVQVTWNDSGKVITSEATVEMRSTLLADYDPPPFVPLPPPSPIPSPSPIPTPSPSPSPSPLPTPSPSPIPTNIALSKPVIQISTLAAAENPIPERAVDGNTNGNYYAGSVTHTNSHANAWWQVDLGAVYDITQINIYNRTDAAQTRLTNFYTLVSDSSFSSFTLANTLAQPGVSNYLTPATAGSPTVINANRTGRYVRIQLAGTEYLSLTEVQVMGTLASVQPTASSATPVGYWKFNEGTGTTVADSSGNGNTGTWYGSNTFGRWVGVGADHMAGLFSYNYDGLDAGSPAVFDFGNNGPFTAMGWVKRSYMNNYAGFIAKSAVNRGAAYSWMITTMANGQIYLYSNTLGWVPVCPVGTIKIGFWYHIAVSYDGTNAKVFVNGALCGSVPYTYTDNAAYNIHIGNWYAAAPDYSPMGAVDEVKIFNQALKDEQVQVAYQEFANEIVEPVAAWSFNEGTGTTVSDSTGHGHTGTLGGPGGKWFAGGVDGGSLRFNGAGDHVNFGTSSSFNYGYYGPFTFQGWVRPTTLVNYGGFMSKVTPGRNAPYNFMTTTMADGSIQIYNAMTPAWVALCPAGSIVANQWRHIAFTYEGYGSPTRAYVNGVQCGSSTAFNYTSTVTYPLTLGSWYSPSMVYDFNGFMDEVKMFDYPRSASQILSDYSSYTIPANAWYYRLPISISNSTGAALTNYPVRLVINTAALISAGKMKADCSDIRIAIGTTAIPFWLENGTCNTTTTNVWINVASLPTSGISVNAYYGNLSASSTSNATGIFEFFDDFTGPTLDTTTKWNAVGSNSITSGILNILTGSVYSKNTILPNLQNHMFEMRASWGTPTAYSGMHLAEANSVSANNSNADALALYMSNNTTNNQQMAFAADGTVAGYNVTTNTPQYTPAGYAVSGVSYSPSHVRFFSNRTQTNQYATTIPYAPYLLLGSYGAAYGSTNITDLAIDFVIVRKYSTPEPIGVPQTEEVGNWPSF